MLAVSWPHPRVVGWGGEVPAAVPFFDRRPLLALLRTHHDTDAHAVGYLIDDEPRQPRLNKGAPATLAKRGATVCQHTVWVDLDRNHHRPWKGEKGVRIAVDALRDAFPLAGIYTTRAGARLVWVLDEGVPVAVADAWLTRHLADVRDRWSGVHVRNLPDLLVDETSAQWTRCFRLPFTAREGGPAKVTPILDLGPLAAGATLRRGSLADLATSVSVARASTALVRVDMPEVGPPPPWHVELLRGTPLGNALASKVASGAPLASVGGRDTALLAAIGCAARALGTDATPEAVFGLLRGPVAAMVAASPPGDPGPDLAKLWDRCQEIAAREKADRDERIAARVARGDSPVIVVSGARFHVLDADGAGYGPAVPAVALTAELRDRRPDLPRHSRRGAPLATIVLVDKLGTVADRIVAVMGTSRTTYTRDDRTLRLRACPLRGVTARHVPEIAAWLSAFVPDAVSLSGVLDWLATMTHLDRPTAALYLQGPRQGGKSLFVKGAASLWADAPVPFETAIGRFNRTALVACPVVHLSEGLGFLGDGRRRNVSSAFRALVADGVHRVEEKHEVAGDLIGHPRIIVAANNDDALPLGSHHTRDDLAAIAQRILHVRTGDALITWTEAEGWLHDGQGGPGAFAAHVGWLAATREVEAGGRFLVEGREGDYHRGLVLRSGVNSAVLTAIGSALLRGGRQAAAFADDGAAMINAARLHGQWHTLVDEDVPRPTRPTVVRALRELSVGGGAVSRRRDESVLRYWPIPGDLVLRIAEAHGVAHVDRLAAALSGAPAGVAQGAQ